MCLQHLSHCRKTIINSLGGIMNSNPTISETSRPAYKKWLLIGIIWLVVGFVLLEVIPFVNNNSFLPGEKVYDVTGDYDIRTIDGKEYMVFLTKKTVDKRKLPIKVSGTNVRFENVGASIDMTNLQVNGVRYVSKNVDEKAYDKYQKALKAEYRCTVLSGNAFLIEDGEVITDTLYKVEDVKYNCKLTDTSKSVSLKTYVDGIGTVSFGGGPSVWKFKKDASQYQPEERQDLWVVVQGDYHWIFEDKTLVEFYKSNELLICQNTSSKLATSYKDDVSVNEYGHTVVKRANTRMSLARTFGNPDAMMAFMSILVLLVFFIPLLRLHKIFSRHHEDYVMELADNGNVASLKKHLSRVELGRRIAKFLGIALFGLYILMIVIAIFFYDDKSFYGATSNVIKEVVQLDNGAQIIKLQSHANNFLYSILYHFPVLNGDITDYVHAIMSLPSLALVATLCLYPSILLKSMRTKIKKELSRSSLSGKR